MNCHQHAYHTVFVRYSNSLNYLMRKRALIWHTKRKDRQSEQEWCMHLDAITFGHNQISNTIFTLIAIFLSFPLYFASNFHSHRNGFIQHCWLDVFYDKNYIQFKYKYCKHQIWMGVFGKTRLGILNYAKDQMVISGDSKYEFHIYFCRAQWKNTYSITYVIHMISVNYVPKSCCVRGDK